MVPKTYLVSVFMLLSFLAKAQTNRCDNLYAKITYSLSHSKKALTATNFEHQMYYAERAYTALEKSKEYQEECGCPKSKDKTLDVMEVLDKAIEPRDWEAGRFYTKKSVAMINELITIVDECTQNDPQPVVIADSETVTLENEAYVDEEEKQVNSQENEMIQAFNAQAEDRLDSVKNAIDKLVSLSKANHTEPNGLLAHQKAYLKKAKKMLEEGLEELENK